MSLDATQEAARTQFDKQSHRYGKSHILADVSDVDALLALVDSRPGVALDIATGGGHTGLRLAELGWKVTCADIAQGMLDRVSEGANERGLSIETRLHPAEELPDENGSFDLVTCRVAAHHFSSPAEFVKETARVLKPGGWFLLIDGSVQDNEPEVEEWLHRVEKWRDPSHGRFLTPAAWKSLCEKEGFEVLELGITPLKQPDLNWYFETASTTPENREKVLELTKNAPARVTKVLRLETEPDGKIVWWWPRLGMLSRKR